MNDKVILHLEKHLHVKIHCSESIQLIYKEL